MIKYTLYGLAGLIGLIAIIFISQAIASESGEVVILSSRDAEGAKETRLWVVELDGVQYLRAGPDSGWYQRLSAQPQVELTRADVTTSYRAEIHMGVAAEINRLMREKYSWRDVYIEALIGGRDDTIPVAMVEAR